MIPESEPSSIGDLAEFLDPAAARARLSAAGVAVAAATPLWWRAVDQKSAAVSLRLELEESRTSVLAYVKTFAGDDAVRLYDKWTRMKPRPAPDGSDGVRLLPSQKSILFFYPNDGDLDALRDVIDLDRLKRHLAGLGGDFAPPVRVRAQKTTIETIRWKPEHRAVLRADLSMKDDDSGEKFSRVVYLRVYADRKAAAIFELLDGLKSSAVGAFLPRPLGTIVDGSVYVEDEVKGRSLAEALRTTDPIYGRTLGRVIAALHAEAPRASFPDTEATATAVRARLRSLAPFDEAAASRLLSRLSWPTLSAPHDSVIHGDLHPGQVVLGRDGPVLLDFERAGAGSGWADIGLFSAHIDEMMLLCPAEAARFRAFADGFLLGYCERQAADGFALSAFRAAGLIHRAAVAARRGESASAHVRALLAMAGDLHG